MKSKAIGIASSTVGALGTIGGVARIAITVVSIASAAALTVASVAIPIVSVVGIGLSMTLIKYGLKNLSEGKSNVGKSQIKSLSNVSEQEQIKEKIRGYFNKKKE